MTLEFHTNRGCPQGSKTSDRRCDRAIDKQLTPYHPPLLSLSLPGQPQVTPFTWQHHHLKARRADMLLQPQVWLRRDTDNELTLMVDCFRPQPHPNIVPVGMMNTRDGRRAARDNCSCITYSRQCPPTPVRLFTRRHLCSFHRRGQYLIDAIDSITY